MVTQAAFTDGSGSWTRSGLHSATRSLRRSRISTLTFGWLCVLAATGLSAIGILAIRTAEAGAADRQIAFLCIAIMGATIAAAIPYRVLLRLQWPLICLALGLLIFVLLPFVPDSIVHPRKGARRWIRMPFVDFQPSELAKLVYIIAIAAYLPKRQNYRRFWGLLIPLGLSLIPMALILREPDLGTAMLFLPTLYAMLVGAGAKIWHLILIMLIGIVAAVVLYQSSLLMSHQMRRIDALKYQLVGDDRLADDEGYQGAKAMMLVGAGETTGVGAAYGQQLVRYNVLPESKNDMIFAVITVRWGAIGAVVTWGLFLVLCAGGLMVAARTNDPFGRLLAIGIVCLIFAEMTINTGMTIGVLPITGMNLPFVSYGGTSLIASWLMIGLLLNIGLRRPQFLAREAREFDQYHESV